MSTHHKRVISFGPFRLLPTEQLLLEGDTPVRIGSRAREVLAALLERPGQIVSKEELLARVWPTTVVEEGNLKVHVAALRRVLGDGIAGNRYVTNIPGRGYCFVAPISYARTDGPSTSWGDADHGAHNVPPPPARIVGRAEIVEKLLASLRERRFVTIAGGGGIGKTTVALAVADALKAKYRDGIRFVDLAPLADPNLVPSAVAATLELALHTESPLSGLTEFLKNKQILLVLDSCEHVIEAAALLAEALFVAAPNVHILATSREPLGAEGERVHRLAPLGLPPKSEGLTATTALTFPAVQLFVERAASTLDAFDFTDADAPFIADICRNLDGIALAIEIVACRLDVLGVRGVAAQLDGRFKLLTRGMRSALPRHQTLSAALDWSYEFLPESERVAFRRLAVFPGWFSESAAIAVASSDEIPPWQVIDIVASMFAKSLVVVDLTDAAPVYRLLETTRTYAFEKLIQSGEVDEIAKRHAHYLKDLFERADVEWESLSTEVWLASYRRHIDGLRAALDWAYSPSGNEAIGVALTVAATSLLMHLSLADECRRRAEQALACIRAEASRNGPTGMKLYLALGLSLLFTKGASPEALTALTKASKLAEMLGDKDVRLRAVWGLWANRQNNGVFDEALVLARNFRDLASESPDRLDVLVGDRMIGSSLHFLGDQAGARLHIDRMLAKYVAPSRRSHLVRFQFEQKATGSITLARVLWLMGCADQAMRTVESNIEYAQALHHTLSLCNALAQAACPVSLLSGDLAAAERYIELLIHHTVGNKLDVWNAYGRGCRGVLLIKRGDLAGGIRSLQAAIDDLSEAHFMQYQTAFLASLAEGLAEAGRFAHALAAINDALTQIQRTGGRWALPEVLRAKGAVILLAGAEHAETEAQALFAQSIVLARQQGALAWELRSANSLARQHQAVGRVSEAKDLLAPIYASFAEGFETADLRTARQILQSLNESKGRTP
jgi:predicted ATPase/DNA-binding winged helix-turn-helix (wHTH) protein